MMNILRANKMKTRWKVSLILFGIICSIIISNLLTENDKEFFNHKIIPLEFKKGVITQKYKTRKDSPFIDITDKSKFIRLMLYDYYDKGLWRASDVGDSIYKEKNSKEFILYKKNGDSLIFILDYK